MILIHNLPGFPKTWTAAGHHGSSLHAENAAAFLAHRANPEALFLINGDSGLTMRLAARMLWGPRRPIVAVDLVLRAPETFGARLQLPLKRALLRRVDHFIHYFRDLSGYSRVFGISSDRSAFVPFKVNLISRHRLESRPEGEYVLCFGRSMRDYDTFFAAMERLPYPAAITRPAPRAMAAHHGRFTRDLSKLPANVRILEDTGTELSEIEILSNARILALPILKKSMAASGISTCLNAMYLGKCVVGSEGPGMSDVFTSEVRTVPAEDPAALAEAIREVWEDPALRQATAAAGRRYALEAGAEPELYQRILNQIVAWYPPRS